MFEKSQSEAKYKDFIEFAQYVHANIQRETSRIEIKKILAVVLSCLQEIAQEIQTSTKNHNISHQTFQKLLQIFSEVMQSVSTIQECKVKINDFISQELIKYYTHDFSADTSQIVTHLSSVPKVQYVCHCPEKKHFITLDVHEKIAMQQTQFRCRTCKHFIVFEAFC